MISARLIAVTRPLPGVLPEGHDTPEGLIEWCARVSNPANQRRRMPVGRLLAYLMREGHWSPLEMAHAVVEVECPRDIARQILRHRSFSFQEFSQRYAAALALTRRAARRQDESNRQSSHDDLPEVVRGWWADAQDRIAAVVEAVYGEALGMGIARECARVVLPEGLTMSRLYMAGSLRSYVHYLAVREGNGTQAEHQEVAQAIRAALRPEFPVLMEEAA